jgi:hypothetical protein
MPTFSNDLGVRVHRTDVTAEFRDFQAERGQEVDALDVLTDEIAGTYDGILMLCVLQHFERAEIDIVLRKLVNALRVEGALLLSHPVGEDEFWEHASLGRLPCGALVERNAGRSRATLRLNRPLGQVRGRRRRRSVAHSARAEDRVSPRAWWLFLARPARRTRGAGRADGDRGEGWHRPAASETCCAH